MIRVVARFHLKPGTADQALETAKPLIELTRKEAGCIQYDLAKSSTDETLMVILEAWNDQQSLDAHSASAHFRQYVPELAKLCQSAPVVDTFLQIL